MVVTVLILYLLAYLFCVHLLSTEMSLKDVLCLFCISLPIILVIVVLIQLVKGQVVLLLLIGVEMLITLVYFWWKNFSIYNLAMTLVSYIIMALPTQITELVFFKLFDISYNAQKTSVLLLSLNSVVSILISALLAWLLGLTINKYKVYQLMSRRVDVLKLSGMLASLIVVFFIALAFSSSIPKSRTDSQYSNMIILSVILIFSLMIFIFVWSYIKQAKEKLNYEKTINNQLKSYLESLEEMESSLRRYRHDFINIYGGLAGYIEADDMEGLKKYYYNEIERIDAEQNKKSFQLKTLKNMNIIEIKGLLSLKLTKAVSHNIELNIEIMNPVTEVYLPIYVFNRCLGIFIDNAIEETLQINDGARKIDIVLFSEANKLSLIVKNKLNHDVSVDQIFKDGFSTKGKNRGLGLAEVENILRENKNCILETKADDGYFTQIMTLFRGE